MEKGSIIKRPVKGFWGLFYKHMGVYIGNNEVIHFDGEKKKNKNARLKRDSLKNFSKGFNIKIHLLPKNNAHAEAICKKAEDYFFNQKNKFNGKYSPIFKNCEDFCIKCYEVEYEE